MKKVFLDTNVILDFVQKREGAEFAEQILQLGLNKKIELFVSDLTVVNTVFIAQKSIKKEEMYEFLAFLRRFVDVLSISKQAIDTAISAKHKDFEDYLQYYVAKDNDMDCIVTSNLKDFSFTDIQIYSPLEFLSHL